MDFFSCHFLRVALPHSSVFLEGSLKLCVGLLVDLLYLCFGSVGSCLTRDSSLLSLFGSHPRETHFARIEGRAIYRYCSTGINLYQLRSTHSLASFTQQVSGRSRAMDSSQDTGDSRSV